MLTGQTLLTALWDELDAKVAAMVPMRTEIKAMTDTTKQLEAIADANKLGGIGRGLAIAVRLVSPDGSYVDDDAVVRHAMARYQASLKGETVTTPGFDVADEAPPPAKKRGRPRKTAAPGATAKKPETSAPAPATASDIPPKTEEQAAEQIRRDEAAAKELAKKELGLTPVEPDDPNRPPTPDDVLTQHNPNTAMSVEEALQRARARAAKRNGVELDENGNLPIDTRITAPGSAEPDPTLEFSENGEPQNAEDLAAMLAQLEGSD